jgi:hypothetical protein
MRRSGTRRSVSGRAGTVLQAMVVSPALVSVNGVEADGVPEGEHPGSRSRVNRVRGRGTERMQIGMFLLRWRTPFTGTPQSMTSSKVTFFSRFGHRVRRTHSTLPERLERVA